ncbi:MAG: hypothetical protein WC497_05390 [Patescibacteria group bacterium]
MSPEGEPIPTVDNEAAKVVSERDALKEKERQRQLAQAEMIAIIGQELRNGAFDEYGEVKLDAIVFDDGAGHHHEHSISQDEAEIVVRAMWGASTTEYDSLCTHVYNQLQAAGFDIQEPSAIKVRLVKTSQEQK